VRLAWFSPWPPQRSGIAGRSAEAVPELAARGHAIDVMVEAAVSPHAAPPTAPEVGNVRVLNAHDFLWRQARGHYDLPIFQIGNSHLHRFIWPYLFRFPGLAVLHDARVHHARAEALLSSARDADYRAEFAWNHPDVPPGIAELAVLGIEGVYFYAWPMIRGVVESARLVACHSRGVMDELSARFPAVPFVHVALGEGDGDLDTVSARESFRRAHQIPAETIVFGAFGGLTAEKRVLELLAAFTATLPWMPDARLLLVGAAEEALDLNARITGLGIERSICRIPSPDDVTFDQAIAACDVVINLRWPTTQETSGPWVRALALGRPTVVIDLAHQTHVPSLDPRTWRLHEPAADPSGEADRNAVMVALDIRDLRHSLIAAMRRLATDRPLRDRLGRAARRWWEQEHTVARMIDDYERAIARAMSAPSPTPDWPAHMRPEPGSHARDLLQGAPWQDSAIRDRLAPIVPEVP
jgi:glycosyltransferase involved in cell wall biosynthesis